ncbi:MAG: metallophosphoesterase family protein, partial [Proteobacteria bacterium]|nr:metallophosphoesterase family protein [Pseudomonadota bacterium]
MRLAVIADIHGNSLALHAVLDDIARRGIGFMVNLGDCVSGPLWPRETLALLQAAAIPTVRGNHDRWVAEGGGGASDDFARNDLDEAQVARLGALPPALEVAPGVLAFHARPADDNAYLLEDAAGGRLVTASPEDVAARLGDVGEAALLLCGHSHLPGLMALPGGRVVLNPGSVGCPAYTDPSPPAHVSETGAPFARYAIAEIEDGRFLGA